MEVVWELILSIEQNHAVMRKRLFGDVSEPLLSRKVWSSQFLSNKTRNLLGIEVGGKHLSVHLEGRTKCILCRLKHRAGEGEGIQNLVKT